MCFFWTSWSPWPSLYLKMFWDPPKNFKFFQGPWANLLVRVNGFFLCCMCWHLFHLIWVYQRPRIYWVCQGICLKFVSCIDYLKQWVRCGRRCGRNWGCSGWSRQLFDRGTPDTAVEEVRFGPGLTRLVEPTYSSNQGTGWTGTTPGIVAVTHGHWRGYQYFHVHFGQFISCTTFKSFGV